MSQGPSPSIPPGNNVSYQPPASSDQALPWSPWAISVSSIALIVNHELPAIAQPLFSWNTKCFLYLGICVSSFQQACKLLEGIYLCLNTMLSTYKKTYQLCLDFFCKCPAWQNADPSQETLILQDLHLYFSIVGTRNKPPRLYSLLLISSPISSPTISSWWLKAGSWFLPNQELTRLYLLPCLKNQGCGLESSCKVCDMGCAVICFCVRLIYNVSSPTML